MSTEILSIDVSSELETLCEAQLRGRWQVPAELVRMALRLGATEVSVERKRRGFAIGWKGPLLGFDELSNLRSALDAGRGPEDRQRAIASLEVSGMEGLLWAAGLRGARIRVECTGDGRRWSFEHRHRGRPRLTRDPGLDQPSGVEIRWSCAGLDRRRALRWLAIAARFAPAPVLVNGLPARRGFAGGLYHLRLEEPLPGRIGLTRTGDEPVLWLLQDGVVSARASVPGYPSFEAAVELGDLVAPGASAADMRRAVSPFLGELVDRAVWMMVEIADRLPEMTEGNRERLGLLLLRAARRGLRTRQICRLPLLQTAAVDGHRLSVEAVRELADRHGGVLAAVEVGESPGEAMMDPGSTLVVSSEIRDLLSEMTAVRFQTPSRRHRGLPVRVAIRLRAGAGHVLRRMRGLFAGRDVPQSDLRSEEVLVLEAIRAAMSPFAVDLCEGAGAVGRTRRRLVVPRSNPVMRAGADLIAADRAWVYPLLLALDTGREPPAELRERWLETMGTVSEGI